MGAIFVVRAHYLTSYHLARETAHTWTQSTQKAGVGGNRIKDQLGLRCDFQVDTDYKMRSYSTSEMKHIYSLCCTRNCFSLIPEIWYLLCIFNTNSQPLRSSEKTCSYPFLVINTFRFCRWVIILLCLQSSSVLSQRTIFQHLFNEAVYKEVLTNDSTICFSVMLIF